MIGAVPKKTFDDYPEKIQPFRISTETLGGSTDDGDISWVTPAVGIMEKKEFLARRGANFKYEPMLDDRKPALDDRK